MFSNTCFSLTRLSVSCCRTQRALIQSLEMLQVVTFSFTFLLSGVFSQGCFDFTTADVEGPFFVSNVPTKVGSRLLAISLTCCVLSVQDCSWQWDRGTWQGSHHQRKGEISFSLHDKTCLISSCQILDKNCEGIAGATVDVWYAGGADPRYSFRPSPLQFRGKTQTTQVSLKHL